MKLLDLFCGAGGGAMGYYKAGFTEIIGIDHRKQKRYPFEFVQSDAMEILQDTEFLKQFDLIHASPPCQRYSCSTKANGTAENHPDLLPKVRELLIKSEKPYVIENVPGAPMVNYLNLCGTMFKGLNVIRHRWFECNPLLIIPPACCNHYKKTVKQGRRDDWDKVFHCVVGEFSDIKAARIAMGIDYMTVKELAQAIPPAYTEFIGNQIKNLL
jgi:DNA (cytosine-5)-methyltransferase 1